MNNYNKNNGGAGKHLYWSHEEEKGIFMSWMFSPLHNLNSCCVVYMLKNCWHGMARMLRILNARNVYIGFLRGRGRS